MGYILSLIAGVFWGIAGIFVRYFNTQGLSALDNTEVKMVFGFLSVALYLLCFKREYFKIKFKDIWVFACSGILSIMLMCITYFKSMEFSVSIAAVLLYTAPIFVIIFSAIFFKEKITLKTVLAMIMAFVGCALVCGIMGGDTSMTLPGILIGVASGVAYSLYSIFGRLAINRGYGAWTITLYSFLFCIIGNAFLCDWSKILTVMQEPVNIGWGVAFGVATALIPYVFYSLSLERISGSIASIVCSIEPVVATVVGVFMFNDNFDIYTALGIILTLGAVVVLSIKKKRA